uniref:Uncharacterized protein n=1 Tax=Anopheles culicifacies TaxID=139723 RepID=A0A182M7P4_9DIPT
MSLKRPASTSTPENMLSTERKSMATAAPADRKVVTPKSKQSSNPKTPLAATKSPALATKQTSEVPKIAQSRRLGASAKMPERSSTSWPDKTLSNIVKVKHKKDSGLPVAWRKDLYGTRPGSAQARLETLRTALQQEVEEQKKAKASSSITIKRLENEKCLPKEKVSSLPSQSSKGSVLLVLFQNIQLESILIQLLKFQ